MFILILKKLLCLRQGQVVQMLFLINLFQIQLLINLFRDSINGLHSDLLEVPKPALRRVSSRNEFSLVRIIFTSLPSTSWSKVESSPCISKLKIIIFNKKRKI